MKHNSLSRIYKGTVWQRWNTLWECCWNKELLLPNSVTCVNEPLKENTFLWLTAYILDWMNAPVTPTAPSLSHTLGQSQLRNAYLLGNPDFCLSDHLCPPLRELRVTQEFISHPKGAFTLIWQNNGRVRILADMFLGPAAWQQCQSWLFFACAKLSIYYCLRKNYVALISCQNVSNLNYIWHTVGLSLNQASSWEQSEIGSLGHHCYVQKDMQLLHSSAGPVHGEVSQTNPHRTKNFLLLLFSLLLLPDNRKKCQEKGN